MDRIQQLRREYLQARIEGAAPSYEELEARRRGPEYDQHRVRFLISMCFFPGKIKVYISTEELIYTIELGTEFIHNI